MAQNPTIDCWITLGSTYSYLTVMRLPEVSKRSGVSVRFRPFNLRKLFDERNYFPFPENSPKTEYMWKDLRRRADMYGIRVGDEVPYPAKGSRVATRIALVGLQEGWGDDFIRASYRAWFQDGLEMGSDSNLAKSLGEVGQDVQRVTELAASSEIEKQFENETDEARSLGVFGAPTFAVGDQLFWGDDRLEDAISWALHGHVRRDPFPA